MYFQLACRAYFYSLLFFALLEAKKTTWLPALLGRKAARRISANVLVVIAKVLLLSPWFMFLIWFDNTMIHLPVLFPRTRTEIMNRQQRFFQWLTGGEQSVHRDRFHVVESNAVLLARQRDGD